VIILDNYEVAKKKLVDSGWYEGRKIDISEMESSLAKDGYVIPNIAKDFLKEFGLLEISFANPRNSKYTNTIMVDPRKVGVYKSVIDAYSRHCNKMMVPVADLPKHCMTICISEDGEFFGGYDDWLLRLGDSFYEALFNLISGTKIKPEMVELDD
jgi:hypothetical protein